MEPKKHTARARIIDGVVFVSASDLISFIQSHEHPVLGEVKRKLGDLILNTQKKQHEVKK